MKKSVIYLLLILVFFNCGCHSFRKKFIRKKKHEKEPPVYINFKDYQSGLTREGYINYYLFVRGWLDELIGALERNESFKRKKRAIDEAVMNMEQIIYYFNDQGREEVYPIHQGLVAIQEQIMAQPNMSTIKSNSLTRKTQSFKRRFEKGFNYTDAEQWLN